MQVDQVAEESYARGVARAAAGALIFGFPLLMTMEMWELGFHMDRLRLALFLVVTALVVFGLSRFAGFRDDTTFVDDILDSLAALLVGYAVSGALLWLMALIGPDTGARETIGMIAIQAAPASMGAMLANRQLGQRAPGTLKEDRAGYLGQLFLMGAGALFFAFAVAPTEEMILIGFKMSPWHTLALIVVSLILLHLLVFTVGFGGQKSHGRHLQAFMHFSLAGYGIALLVSLYVLWTFGRLDGGLNATVRAVAVLSFPSAMGAALARLVV
jgi:putative integral membrane protein (TIGR02587 family)